MSTEVYEVGSWFIRMAFGWFMLPYWQRKNDNLATAMLGMAHYYPIPEATLALKRHYWSKCVYWGEHEF